MNKPIAVIINDVHYNVHTLEVADKAMRMAIDKANSLDIPLIVAGDLHDTKANLRGECVNAMLKTFNTCELKPLILVGNHDKINEKSEDHSLNFLEDKVNFIVDKPQSFNLSVVDNEEFKVYIIPYQYDPEVLKEYLKTVPDGSTIICHQGITNSNSGDYFKDNSAVPRECFENFRTISGHYHASQDIKCGRPRKGAVGLFTYTGNPYTLTYGEANDPPKGFHVLYDDGLLEFIPTNLRKHVIFDLEASSYSLHAIVCNSRVNPDDLLWVKARGTRDQLQECTKQELSKWIKIPFKLEHIATDAVENVTLNTQNLPQSEVLDSVIDSISGSSDEQKDRLKKLWRTYAN